MITWHVLFQLGLFGEGSRCSAEWAGEEFPLRSDRRQRIGDGLEGLTNLQEDPVLSQDCCIQVIWSPPGIEDDLCLLWKPDAPHCQRSQRQLLQSFDSRRSQGAWDWLHSSNSEACEQTNSVLRKVAHSTTFMSPSMYMRSLTLFLADLNISMNNKKKWNSVLIDLLRNYQTGWASCVSSCQC